LIQLEFNKSMKQLLNAGWLNADTLGYIAGEILQATIGKGKIAHQQFKQGQSTWAPLSPKTLDDRRKKSKFKFFHSGRVLTAITTPLQKGRLLSWGGSADVYSTAQRPKRYNANGIWASAKANSKGVVIQAGFAGKLTHSRQFTAARKKLAAEKGIDVWGKGAKSRIAGAVSVHETTKFLKQSGKPYKKYTAAGALGIGDNGKMVLARGKDNLAYADIVQAGAFKGIKDNSNGKFYKPAAAAKFKSRISSDYTAVRSKDPRPILPYLDNAWPAIQDAITRGVSGIFRKIEGR